jgi:hypothetical protein
MLYACYIYRDPKSIDNGPEWIRYIRAESDQDAIAHATILLEKDRLALSLKDANLAMEVREIMDVTYGDGSGCLQVRVVQDAHESIRGLV